MQKFLLLALCCGLAACGEEKDSNPAHSAYLQAQDAYFMAQSAGAEPHELCQLAGEASRKALFAGEQSGYTILRQSSELHCENAARGEAAKAAFGQAVNAADDAAGDLISGR